MDIITRIKKSLDTLYSNKLFRMLFFLFVALVIIYKYSNVKTGINNIYENNKKNAVNNKEIEKPKKINVFKAITDEVYIKNFNREQERKKRLNKEKIEEMKRLAELKKEKEMEALKKEFEPSSKKGRIIKNGDLVNVKMLVTKGSDFNNFSSTPISFQIKVDNKSNNIIGKKLLNNRVGDVILIYIGEFLNEESFQKNIQQAKQQNEDIKNINIDSAIDLMKKSGLIYRIKIVSVEGNNTK